MYKANQLSRVRTVAIPGRGKTSPSAEIGGIIWSSGRNKPKSAKRPNTAQKTR